MPTPDILKNNMFYRVVPIQAGALGIDVAMEPKKYKGYRLNTNRTLYLKNTNKLELKPAGWLALGLITIAGMEVIKSLLK